MQLREEKLDKIKIYDAEDFPFGPLSNNFNHEITIDNNNYPTVSNYIYSNMLIKPLYKIMIQNAQIKGEKKFLDVNSLNLFSRKSS
jgi:predicted NAD-dependent protein-ADP-ribosyltransferase YbiA (DUF1768 family)